MIIKEVYFLKKWETRIEKKEKKIHIYIIKWAYSVLVLLKLQYCENERLNLRKEKCYVHFQWAKLILIKTLFCICCIVTLFYFILLLTIWSESWEKKVKIVRQNEHSSIGIVLVLLTLKSKIWFSHSIYYLKKNLSQFILIY